MPQQRILITGAGSGLGRALARRYARAGYAVACADIQLLHAEETVALLGPPVAGGPHLALPVDVGDDASWSTLATQLAAHWDTLDVLINNAGISSAGTLLEAPMAEWQQILNVNLLGVVRGCRTFAPQLVRQGHGRIINIASFAGLAGAPAIMSYGVAKAGVVAPVRATEGGAPPPARRSLGRVPGVLQDQPARQLPHQQCAPETDGRAGNGEVPDRRRRGGGDRVHGGGAG